MAFLSPTLSDYLNRVRTEFGQLIALDLSDDGVADAVKIEAGNDAGLEVAGEIIDLHVTLGNYALERLMALTPKLQVDQSNIENIIEDIHACLAQLESTGRIRLREEVSEDVTRELLVLAIERACAALFGEPGILEPSRRRH